MTLPEMIKAVREGREITQKRMAEAIGITPQYLCDLEHGRRPGSVEVVNRICDWMGRGPKGRREWHIAGARSHGWDV